MIEITAYVFLSRRPIDREGWPTQLREVRATCDRTAEHIAGPAERT